MLEIIIRESKVSTRDLKDKLYNIKIINFKGNILGKLTYMQILQDMILLENNSY